MLSCIIIALIFAFRSEGSLRLISASRDVASVEAAFALDKLFEYMASGKPIISTVHMGYSIIKRYNCGVELSEDTPDALAEEIMRFHDKSKEERGTIGHNASEGAKNFDFNVLTEKLVKVIKSVV